MAPTILSILKTHPISLKENLLTIANAIDLPLTSKGTKAQLQAEIDDLANKKPELERKIRDVAQTISEKHRGANDAHGSQQLIGEATIPTLESDQSQTETSWIHPPLSSQIQ